MRLVVAAVQVAHFRLGLRLQSPFDVVKAWLQEWEQPRKPRSAVELPIRRVHVRLVPDPFAVMLSTPEAFFARLSTERPRRRQPRVAEQTWSLHAGSHREFKRYSFMPLDRAVVLWEADGYVLAADATVVQQT